VRGGRRVAGRGSEGGLKGENKGSSGEKVVEVHGEGGTGKIG